MKLEAIAISARAHDAWRFDDAGHAVAASDMVEDFQVRNLGFQVRYRYELAPLSYLYVVYARGGYEQLAGTDGFITTTGIDHMPALATGHPSPESH